jgi:hypothetical protein
MEKEGLGREPLNRPKWKAVFDWFYTCNINYETEVQQNGFAEGYSCYDAQGYMIVVDTVVNVAVTVYQTSVFIYTSLP